MGNIFNKGLDKDDQKGELFKRLQNIKGKNEELLKTFSTANRVSKTAIGESDFNYDSRYAFYRDFVKFRRMVSIESKHRKLKEIYKLLSDFKNHKPITTEAKNRKDRTLNNVNQLYNKSLDTYKKNYDSEDLNKGDGNFLTLSTLKYLVRKKNQNRLKKILRESRKNHSSLK